MVLFLETGSFYITVCVDLAGLQPAVILHHTGPKKLKVKRRSRVLSLVCIHDLTIFSLSLLCPSAFSQHFLVISYVPSTELPSRCSELFSRSLPFSSICSRSTENGTEAEALFTRIVTWDPSEGEIRLN